MGWKGKRKFGNRCYSLARREELDGYAAVGWHCGTWRGDLTCSLWGRDNQISVTFEVKSVQ